jgi:hypothetical protein
MKNIQRCLFLLFAWLVAQQALAQGQPQTNVACKNLSSEVFYTGDVFVNYGSTSNAFNTKRRANVTVGLPTVGGSFNQNYIANFGPWSRLLLSPAAPAVLATQGDLPDRIQITWEPDPLSPTASGGFNIYRDGALISSEDADVRSFVDFNVIAGQFYTYTVTGKNQFGEGFKGTALGFLNPNGVVTGAVKTLAGNPVLEAIVTLTPTLGSALDFSGTSMAFAEPNPVFPTGNFTVSCWVKLGTGNDEAGILDFGSDVNKNFWIHTLPLVSGKGVRVGIGTGASANTLEYVFPGASADDWHHIALTYNGASAILYADGEFAGTLPTTRSASPEKLFLGRRSDGAGNFIGKLDDVRMFNRQLSQTEIQMTQNRTIGSETNGLVAYWKFDEGTGSKGFDISTNKILTYLCGVRWTDDKPEVQNAGITDERGIYKIEGINYGPGTTFTATPSKNFYFNQALEFNGSNQQSADLTTFNLPDTSTVTLFVKPFVLTGEQTILSKQGAGGSAQMRVGLSGNTLLVGIGSTETAFGTLSAGYHHLAVTTLRSGGSVSAKVFVDGTQIGGEETFAGVDADFNNGSPWTLGGSRSSGGNTDERFFTGLVDELAVFEKNLDLADIQEYLGIGTDDASTALKHYFNLNESGLDSLPDMGTAMTGKGVLRGATWSTSVALVETAPHEFLPSAKLVTLTPSNTSTDQVDFIDLSTIPVSGYVRFDGTTCFAEGVEILVNGQHYSPPVFTDAKGKFVVDLEPGATVLLEPTYKGHDFAPKVWEVRNASTPVAGILFRDLTKRSIRGQMAGGLCRKSIIPEGGFAKVKVASKNECFEREITLTYDDNEDGKFNFTNLPPMEMTIAVTQHVVNDIYNYFQIKGGSETDLSEKSDTIDFIYFSAPEVEVTMLDTNKCGQPMLDQFENYKLDVRVYQPYFGGDCYLETAELSFFNDIADLPQFDTMMTGGKFKYAFKSGIPNIAAPYKKFLQISAISDSLTTTTTLEAVVLGKRSRESTFASTSPEIPLLILRDPPGDGSFATFQKGTTMCTGFGISVKDAISGSAEFKEKLGFEQEIAVGVGTEKTTKLKTEDTETFSVSANRTQTLSNNMEVCFTFEETVQTSAGDVILGDEADIYMGGALNLLFGITDDLVFDSTTCTFQLEKGLLVFPDKFQTTFIYTDHQIRNIVIPNLITIGDMASVMQWESIMQRNRDQKKAAAYVDNISFDAGVVYERSMSESISQSESYEFELGVSEEVTSEFGFEIDGSGASGKMGVKIELGVSASNSISSERTTTTSFHLEDDDILDNFTLDVKRCRTYGTPVFSVISGQSSCPYECACLYDPTKPKMQPREEVAISPASLAMFNVPENDAAVFEINLGNLAQSGDNGFYTLAVVPESNGAGAVVVANGDVLFAPLTFQIPPNESVPVTISVLRGPAAFEYNDLKLALYSQCQFEQAVARGLLRSQIDPKFYKEITFDVHFLEPCSEVEVTFPLQNWTLIPADGNTLFITLGDYDINDADLDLMRVQYRRTQGDGAWINIAEVPKADLGALFEIVPWNTLGLSDGLYEIRAIAECIGGINPGISHVVYGKIERTPPEIFGTPQPADGVLSRGDEISIQFTEPIRCDLLIQADFFNNNNVGLYDTETGELIDATITCQGDKIIIVPNVANRFIENKVLRVEVDNIRDLASNNFSHAEWEFFVDRNPIRWDGGNVKVTKRKPEFVTVTRRILNDGGQATAWELEDVPTWARVYPTSGVLLPGAAELITFEFDSTLAFGQYLDTISINAPEGREPLIVNCRVLCESPDWVFSPAAFPHTMNFALQLDIEGQLSTDEEDLVAAFIDGELRGLGKLQLLPTLPPLGTQYRVFMTVYGNDTDDSKPVKFEIWDASACLRYGEVIEQFQFEVDNVIGTVGSPVVLHTNSMVRRDIPLTTGWNWISFNLLHPNPALNSALASLQHPQNDLFKNQTTFSEYAGGWFGSLAAINNTSMFQYRADVPDTIQMRGALIDPAALNIPVSAGWNWVGYIPNYALPVSVALGGLTPLNGDIIKGQTAFAQFIAGFGWLGSLQFLEPPKGYQLKISNPGTITYPANFADNPAQARGETNIHHSSFIIHHSNWTVDPTKFEHTITVVGMFAAGGQNATLESHEIGVFAGNELRGSAQAIYIEPLDAHLFFLTAYANTSGEQLQFKLFDSGSGSQSSDLAETLFFTANQHSGSVLSPVPFTLQTTGVAEVPAEIFLSVRPNPFTRNDGHPVRLRTGPGSAAFDDGHDGPRGIATENRCRTGPEYLPLECRFGERRRVLRAGGNGGGNRG